MTFFKCIHVYPINLKFVNVWTKARLKFTIIMAMQIEYMTKKMSGAGGMFKETNRASF